MSSMQPNKAPLPFYLQPRLARFYNSQFEWSDPTSSQVSPVSTTVVHLRGDLSPRAVSASTPIPYQASVQLVNSMSVNSDIAISEATTKAREKTLQSCMAIGSACNSSHNSITFPHAPSAPTATTTTTGTNCQSATNTLSTCPARRKASPVLEEQRAQTLSEDSRPGEDIWDTTSVSGHNTLDHCEVTSDVAGKDFSSHSSVQVSSQRHSMENGTTAAVHTASLEPRSGTMDRFICTPDHPVHAAQMICGYWDGSAQLAETDKPAVLSYVDLKNSVRFNIIPRTRDGKKLSSPMPKRCKSVNQENVVLEPHLECLTREQLRDYISKQLRLLADETTLPALDTAELTPIVFRRIHKKHALAYRQSSPDISSNCSEASNPPLRRSSRRSMVKQPQVQQSQTKTLRLPDIHTKNNKAPSKTRDKTTCVILGFWANSDGETDYDKHAFVGIITSRYSSDVVMKTYVVSRTRYGRDYVGNLDKGAHVSMPIFNGVLEPELQGLSHEQLKDYVCLCLDAMAKTGKEFGGQGIVNMEALQAALASSEEDGDNSSTKSTLAEEVEETIVEVDAEQTSKEENAEGESRLEPTTGRSGGLDGLRRDVDSGQPSRDVQAMPTLAASCAQVTWPGIRTARVAPRRRKKRGIENDEQGGRKKAKAVHVEGEEQENPTSEKKNHRMTPPGIAFASESPQAAPTTLALTTVPISLKAALEASQDTITTPAESHLSGRDTTVEDYEVSSSLDVNAIPMVLDGQLSTISDGFALNQPSSTSYPPSVVLGDIEFPSTMEGVQNNSSTIEIQRPMSDLQSTIANIAFPQSEKQGIHTSLNGVNGATLEIISNEPCDDSTASPLKASYNSAGVVSQKTIIATMDSIQSSVMIPSNSNKERVSDERDYSFETPSHAATSFDRRIVQAQQVVNISEDLITIKGTAYTRKPRPPFQDKLVSDKLNVVVHNNATYLQFDILEFVHEEVELLDGLWCTIIDDEMGGDAIRIRDNQNVHIVNGVAMEVISRSKEFEWTANLRKNDGVNRQSVSTMPYNLQPSTNRPATTAPEDLIEIGKASYLRKSKPPFQNKLVSEKLHVVDRNDAAYLEFSILESVHDEVEFSDGLWYTTTTDGTDSYAIGIRDNQNVHMVNGVPMEVTRRLKQFTWTPRRNIRGGSKVFGHRI